MNDILKGATITIGREEGRSRLIVAVSKGGKNYVGAIGGDGSVPNCVSRYNAAMNTGHARLTVGSNGKITIENLKPSNFTYVNGTEVMSKAISDDAVIELGMYRFKVTAATLLTAAGKLVPKPAPEADIRPLEQVYDDYHQAQMNLQKRARTLNAFSRGGSLFTLGSGFMKFVPALGDYADLFMGMFLVGLIITVVTIYMSFTDKTTDKLDSLTTNFQKTYVCPKCGFFLGMRPYHLLIQVDNCPNPKCKAKFIK